MSKSRILNKSCLFCDQKFIFVNKTDKLSACAWQTKAIELEIKSYTYILKYNKLLVKTEDNDFVDNKNAFIRAIYICI